MREDWLPEFCFASGNFLELSGHQPYQCEPVTVQAGCGRQLKKVFKILQLDLDIA
jgi:hypothetical protein